MAELDNMNEVEDEFGDFEQADTKMKARMAESNQNNNEEQQKKTDEIVEHIEKKVEGVNSIDLFQDETKNIHKEKIETIEETKIMEINQIINKNEELTFDENVEKKQEVSNECSKDLFSEQLGKNNAEKEKENQDDRSKDLLGESNNEQLAEKSDELKNEQCIDNENLNGIKEETIKEEVQDIAFGLENPETKINEEKLDANMDDQKSNLHSDPLKNNETANLFSFEDNIQKESEKEEFDQKEKSSPQSKDFHWSENSPEKTESKQQDLPQQEDLHQEPIPQQLFLIQKNENSHDINYNANENPEFAEEFGDFNSHNVNIEEDLERKQSNNDNVNFSENSPSKEKKFDEIEEKKDVFEDEIQNPSQIDEPNENPVKETLQDESQENVETIKHDENENQLFEQKNNFGDFNDYEIPKETEAPQKSEPIVVIEEQKENINEVTGEKPSNDQGKTLSSPKIKEKEEEEEEDEEFGDFNCNEDVKIEKDNEINVEKDEDMTKKENIENNENLFPVNNKLEKLDKINDNEKKEEMEDEDLDFGDFNTNTDNFVPTTQKEPEKLKGKNDDIDLFGNENPQKEGETFNFSNNISNEFSSKNFSTAFSTNFANFNFFQKSPEENKNDFVTNEHPKKEINENDDIFREEETKAKEETKSPLFGSEQSFGESHHEDSAKKEKKKDFSLFGETKENLSEMLKRVSAFLEQPFHECALKENFIRIEDEEEGELYKKLLNQANAEKKKNVDNLLKETSERVMGIFINENLTKFLDDRKQKIHNFKEYVDEKLLLNLVAKIKQLNNNWKTSNLRTSFLTTLNIQDEGNEDEHNELETEHPKPLTKSERTKSKVTLKIEKKPSKNTEITSPLIPSAFLKDLNKSKKKSIEISEMVLKKPESKNFEEQKSSSMKNKNPIKKEESEPDSPLSAPDNNEEVSRRDANKLKNEQKSQTLNINSKSEISIMKSETIKKNIEEKNIAVQNILQALPPYEFLFADKIIYKVTQKI